MSKRHDDTLYRTGVVVFILVHVWSISGTTHVHLSNEQSETRKTLTRHHGQSCEMNFKEHLHKCMVPFTRKVEMYTNTTSQNLFMYRIFVKYVCRQYKKMLHCTHTTLTNCQTPENIWLVQQRLRHNWVTKLNQMCQIRLNTHVHTKDDEQRLSNKNTSYSEGKSNHGISEEESGLLQSNKEIKQKGLHPYNISQRFNVSKDSVTVIAFFEGGRVHATNTMTVDTMGMNSLLRLLLNKGQKPYLVQLFYPSIGHEHNRSHPSLMNEQFFSYNSSACISFQCFMWIIYAFTIFAVYFH